MSQSWKTAAIFVGLVALGAGSRLLFGMPNLHAVTAAALFAGFYFQSRVLAVAVPLTAMAISDGVLGGYDLEIQLAVYGAMLLPLAFRPLLRNRLTPMRVAASSVISSLAFFLISNLAVWHCWFPHTSEDLVRCYAQALPFLRLSMGGDLICSIVLFGSYAVAREMAAATAQRAETEPARVAA